MTEKSDPQRPRRHRGRPSGPVGRQRGDGPTRARLIAARLLDRVERLRAYADLSLNHALAHSGLSGVDRGLCTELLYGTLRWRGRIDFFLSHCLDRSIEELEPSVRSVLRLGAYQLLFSDRIPDTAAVDESVRCARALGAERATGLVNAVLRKLARERGTIALPSLETDPVEHLVHAMSLPRWLAEVWLERFGPQETARLAEASNAPAPNTLRINRTRITREELLERLADRYPEAEPCRLAATGITLPHKGQPSGEPEFREGLYSIQDEASQLVVDLLDPQPGDRILDTCAAPGTKSAAIAERLDGRGSVLALDRHGRRLALVARGARRLGVQGISTLERDATQSLDDLEGAPFDRILVDAPCTGLGALRRNPDARWRVQASDPEKLGRVQLAILKRAAGVLRPGGRLVYSTCTLSRPENESVVEALLESRADLRRVAPSALPESLAPVLTDAGDLLCLPHVHGTDGFYAACLERAGEDAAAPSD